MCDADENFGMTSLPLQTSNLTTVTTLVISVLNRAKPNTEQVLDLRLLKHFTGVQQLNIRPKTAQLGYIRLLFDDDTFSHYTELRTLTVTVPLTNQSLHGIVKHSSGIESLDVNDVKNIGYENACSTMKTCSSAAVPNSWRLRLLCYSAAYQLFTETVETHRASRILQICKFINVQLMQRVKSSCEVSHVIEMHGV